MKNNYRRVTSLVLTIALLFSAMAVPTFAANFAEGSNGKTIYLSTEITDEDGQNINKVSANSYFAVLIRFAGNADTIADSVQNYNLFLQFDNEKMIFDSAADVSATTGPYTKPTANAPKDPGNLVIMGWSNQDGITTGSGSKRVTHQSGILTKLVFKANADLDMADLSKIKLVKNDATDSTKMGEYAVKVVPALDITVDGTLYDTSTASEIRNALTVQYIDVDGTKSDVNSFTVDKTSLDVGENDVTVTANGVSETIKINAVKDDIESIAVTTQPRLAYISGDELDLSGMTVTATCKSGKTKAVTEYISNVAAGTELTVAGHNGKQLTITAEGKSATTNALVVNPASVAIPAATGSYTYTGAEQTFTYSNASDQYTLSGELKGTEARDYSATAELKDTTETVWSDKTNTNKTLTWTIAPNTNALTVTLNSAEDIIYDGNEKRPAVTVKSGDEVLTDSDYTLTYADNQNAGMATVSAEGKGNYAGARGSVTFEIKRAPIEPTISMDGWTYGQETKNPVLSGNTGNGAVTYTYYTNAACTEGGTENKPQDAGTYWVKASVAQSTNYSAGMTEAVSFTIAKAASPSGITGKVTLYHADKTAGTFEVSSLTGVPSTGWTDVKFETDTAMSGDSVLSAAPTVVDGKLNYTPTGTAGANKTATVTATVSSKNYENATVKITFETVDISIDWDAIAADNISLKNAPVYGDKNSDILTIRNPKYTARTTVDVPGTLTVQNVDSYPEAGTTSVTLVFTPDPSTGISGTFTHQYTIPAVAKKSITVTADTKTVVYGEEIPALTFTVPTGALVGNDTVGSLGLVLATSATSTSSVDTYDITGTCTAKNYEVAVNGTGKLTITPAELTITSAAVTSREYIPNDASVAVSGVEFSGLKNGDTLTIDTDYTATGMMTNANAGTDKAVTVAVTLKNTVKNYTLKNGVFESGKVTITKAYHENVTANMEAKYGNTATLNLATLNLPAGYGFGEISTTDDDSIFDGTPSIANETLSAELANDATKASKTATITVTVSSTNYEDYTITVTVTVAAKDAQTITASNINATYGDTGVKVNAKAVGELSYEVTSGADVVAVDASGNVTIKKAGEATIKISAAETNDYATATKNITVTIAKRPLTVKADDKTAYVGAEQPELTYTRIGLVDGDKLTTEPTLKLVHEADVDPMKKAGTYEIAFETQPAASANYDLKTENGTLTVRTRHSSGTTGSTGGVSIDRPENGKVTVSPANPTKGSTVTITVTPNKDQELKSLEVIDQNGNSLPLTDLGNGKFSFVMPEGKVTIKSEFGEANAFVNPYDDVKTGDWYYSAVEYVTVNGLMNGTGKGFEPNLATSRAMIWTILARMSNVNTASSGEWYAAAQQWAVVNGVSDGTMPNDTITREQLAAMLYRYAVSKGMVKGPATADLSVFADANSVSSYAVEAMQWAVSTGLIGGMDGKLNPQGSATRAQVATMLMRFAELEK